MQLGASGGFPAHLEEEAWRLLLEVSLLSSLSFASYLAFCFTLHSYPCIFFHLSGDGSTKKGWFPEGGGPQTGGGGAMLGD